MCNARINTISGGIGTEQRQSKQSSLPPYTPSFKDPKQNMIINFKWYHNPWKGCLEGCEDEKCFCCNDVHD